MNPQEGPPRPHPREGLTVMDDLITHPGFTFYAIVGSGLMLYIIWQLWKVQDRLDELGRR